MRSNAEPPSAEPLESQPYTFPVIESRSHIEIKRGGTVWNETFSSVEIDDITNTMTTPIDHPVVSVKRRCISGIPMRHCVRQWKVNEVTNPSSDLNLALGLSSWDLPLKLTNLSPPHTSDPLPSSHFKTSYHVRSLTALCIGTMTFMSFA